MVGANGFSLILGDHYLLLFAGMIFVLNWVTKTGDYVLDRKLLAAAHDATITHGLKGPNHAVVTACSTGARPIARQ